MMVVVSIAVAILTAIRWGELLTLRSLKPPELRQAPERLFRRYGGHYSRTTGALFVGHNIMKTSIFLHYE